MTDKKPRYFETLDEEEHSSLSSKGGKKSNPNKGFGSMSKEKRREAALKGLRSRYGKLSTDKE